MHILLSNDDGYQADGLVQLASAIGDISKITVVAPERDRSGSSNSLTLERPLRAQRVANGFYSVDGTPTDCVHLAITGLLDSEPDMVVSGINSGPNMGDDVLYSGTVAAATEGRFLGYPALAVSMNSFQPMHYASACKAVVKMIERLRDEPLADNTILNINVPDLDWSEIQGFQATRLGNRHKSEGVIVQQDPRGEPMYWIGPPGSAQDAGEGTDFFAVEHGYISVTPLQIDLTRHKALEGLHQWVSDL